MSADGQVVIGFTETQGLTSELFSYRVGSTAIEIDVGPRVGFGNYPGLSADGSTVTGIANTIALPKGFV